MGRRNEAAVFARARRSAAVVAALATVLLGPAQAAAHPLGNFTINHYAEVRIEPGRILLDVVIDQAEIAAFQARQGYDLDADGAVSDEEIEAARSTACDDLAPDLRLTAGGADIALRTVESGLSFPPGVGGLATMRLVCGYEAVLTAPIGADPVRITFEDGSYPNRIGWREIVARGSGTTIAGVGDPLRETGVSARLTTYPEELVALPLADAALALDALAGGPELPPLDIPDADPLGAPASRPPASSPPPGSWPVPSPAPGSSPAAPSPTPVGGAVPGGIDGGELPAIFTQDLTPLVVLLSLLSAAALGAGHALTPGHGKTLMAAYLVGTRGTPLHALGLGLSVSLSHTVGILVLATIVVGASDVLPPDVVVRWAPLVAAVSIVVIGGWMLVGEVRRRRGTKTTAATAAPHTHDEHGHEGIAHSHAPAPGSTITWRSLFALGLAGGLIPSTSALLILLGSIAAGRPAFGFVLVVAFGLGMAAVMSGIGLALVGARARLDRVAGGVGLTRIRELMPLAAAVVVFAFGVYLTIQAVAGLPAF